MKQQIKERLANLREAMNNGLRWKDEQEARAAIFTDIRNAYYDEEITWEEYEELMGEVNRR